MSSAIGDAIRQKNTSKLQKLLKKSDVSSNALLPFLNLAIAENSAEAVRMIIEKIQKVEDDGSHEKPLHVAASHGASKAIIDTLTGAGCDINTRQMSSGKTALILAAAGGFVETAEAIMSHPECDINAAGDPPKKVQRLDHFQTGKTALMEAIEIGNRGAPIVEALLRHGADPILGGRTQLDGDITPLMQAAMYGLTGIVEMLLQAGVEVDKVDGSAHTALHWAVKGANLGKHTETNVIRPLIAAGANLNALSNSGGDNITPVLRACDIGDFRGPVAHDMAQILIEAGSDINRRDMYGKTIAHRAVGHGWSDILDMVLERGADLNILDSSGHSVLYDVAEAYDVKTEILKKLLDWNCDVRGTYVFLQQCNICIPNCTLMDVAMQQGNLTLLPYLRAAGSPSPTRLYDYESRVTMQDKVFTWVKNTSSQPRTLKEWSRIGVRRAFPVGCHLQAAMPQAPIPNELADYTLLRTGVDHPEAQ